VQEGGRRYLFRLRRDARWSDGQPLTAHDFVFAWRRTLHPAAASPNASLLYDLRGARRFHAGQDPDPASLGVSALDDWTLAVELEEPVGYFMYLMAHYAAFPVPRHAVEALGEAWAAPQHLVCNGPFRLASWKPGESLTLERNPFYTGRFPGNLQAVEFDLVYDHDRFQARYEADELDVVGLGTRHLERMRYRYPGEYLTAPAPGISFMGFNLAYPPLDDRRVRQALVHALDRAALVELLSYGYPMPTSGGFLPPGVPGHSPENSLPYDPERARQLLAEAGFPGGRGLPELNLFALKSKELNRMGEFVARAWKETLGVTLRVQEHDLIEDFNTPELPGMWFITWAADYPDAQEVVGVGVNDARRCLDPQRRARMYQQADRLLAEDAVVMPVNYMRQHLLIKPWVKNFHPGMVHFFFFKDVILEA
jgi:ABC-type oligopeptide transport system substrate-binding subunit